VFQVISVYVIVTTNCQGNHHETLEIVDHKWRLHFCNTWSDWCFKPVEYAEKLTVKMVLPEDGHNKCQNALEY